MVKSKLFTIINGLLREYHPSHLSVLVVCPNSPGFIYVSIFLVYFVHVLYPFKGVWAFRGLLTAMRTLFFPKECLFP